MQTSWFSAAHATMGRNESRVEHLRALRKHAKACGVAAADISAGKEKVTEMMTREKRGREQARNSTVPLLKFLPFKHIGYSTEDM